MAFESLSERYEFDIPGFPEQWLPLIYLYDPDLPLFPLQYFHLLDPALPAGQRPGERDRIFGFIHHVNYLGNTLTVSVAINKDLAAPHNNRFIPPLQEAVKERLGYTGRITYNDIANRLSGSLSHANNLIDELWHKVIVGSFGSSLPFGRMWDGVFGLIRFIASWNSDGGRKGELIQTHLFASEFGVRITTGGGINADYYLLPTFEEFTSLGNPLNLFPKFSTLMAAADDFVNRFCAPLPLGTAQFSKFNMLSTGVGSKLNTATTLEIITLFRGDHRKALFDNYSSFNRGPMRSVVALQMFHDLRHNNWSPTTLTPALCAQMYRGLKGSYQSPKVIHLYAQQCFGSQYVLPLDNWVMTFLRSPLAFRPNNQYHQQLFAASNSWGKLERVIWIASQARKVHSSVAADILWCVRFGGPKKQLRGANPLGCKLCEIQIRDVCPSYAGINQARVVWNARRYPQGGFNIKTSAANNTATGQSFLSVKSKEIFDEYSPRDRPGKFSQYPVSGHTGTAMTVEDFVAQY